MAQNVVVVGLRLVCRVGPTQDGAARRRGWARGVLTWSVILERLLQTEKSVADQVGEQIHRAGHQTLVYFEISSNSITSNLPFPWLREAPRPFSWANVSMWTISFSPMWRVSAGWVLSTQISNLNVGAAM